jgi:hypothetical protein
MENARIRLQRNWRYSKSAEAFEKAFKLNPKDKGAILIWRRHITIKSNTLKRQSILK